MAAAQVQSCLKDLYKLIRNVEDARKVTEPTLNLVSSTHKKVEADGKITMTTRQRLKSLYDEAVKDANKVKFRELRLPLKFEADKLQISPKLCFLFQEEELLRKALNKIYEIRKIRHEMRIASRNAGNKETIRRGALMKMLATSAETIPLWVGKENEAPPPLAGAIPPEPNYVAACGDMAAALVRSPEGDENWILAEVVSYNASTGKYEVDDIDEEQKDRHTLSKRKVIPLPTMRACPETNHEALYDPGTTVMAIYPQTTCFYKGIIKEPPTSGAGDYQILFEDPSYADGYSPPLNVAQRYIIQVSEKKKNK